MKMTNLLRKALCFLLALSVILSMGVGAFAAPAGEAKTDTRAGENDNYGSTKTLLTGENSEDDYFTLQLDAFQRGIVDVTRTGIPLDVTIVLDRSQSMSQPASANSSVYKSFPSYYPGAILYQDPTWGWYTFDHEDIVESAEIKAQITAINAYLDTLDKNAYEGYYRATNYLKRGVPYFVNNHDGYAAAGFASWEPLRYNKTTKQWEMRVTNGLWGGDFPGGINTMDYTGGSILNKEVEWMSVAEAYKEYCARNRRNIYTGKQVDENGKVITTYYDFVITTPRLTKAIDATEDFIRNIYESSSTLEAGQTHRVSILSFGTGALYVGGKYAYNTYDRATDSAIKVESTLTEDLGVSKTITNLNTEANLNSVLNVLHSSYTYTNTRTDWALEAVESNADFLPDNADGSRKQVVVLITDGAPTYADNMESDVANAALVAGKKLKKANVSIYTIGFMAGLDDSADAKEFNSSNPGSAANANSFLKLLSSYYPDSESIAHTEYYYKDTKSTTATTDDTYFWTADRHLYDGRSRYQYQNQTRKLNGMGSKINTENPYYLADNGTGENLKGIFETMQAYIIETAVNPYFREVESLYIYDELTREFALDAESGSIKVYADPYVGNNAYGDRQVIGTHSFTDPEESTTETIAGKGYTIILTKSDELTQIKLDWTDADRAFLREQDYDAGGEYCSTYKKGYKIVMELPVIVDRANTLGGNNIKTNTDKSGFYLPSTDGSAALGADLITYPVPNANVKPDVEEEEDENVGEEVNMELVAYDYFMDLADYAANYRNVDVNSTQAKKVFEAMYQNVQEFDKYLSDNKNAYMNIDIDLLNSANQRVSGYSAKAGATAFTAKGAASGATFDFSADQTLTLRMTLTPEVSENDSCTDVGGGAGVGSFTQEAIASLTVNYYGPKYTVVDFDETVKTSLNQEGKLTPELQSGTTNGKIEGSNICYNFRANYGSGNKSFLEKDYTTVKYQVTAVNAPKSQPNNKTVKRNFYVIPANVMTYDDTFLSFDQNGWETIGTFKDDQVQSSDSKMIHGYDALYNGSYSKDYYHDALKAATVSKTKGIAQATFTIHGTGFDIFAQTSPNSGTMTVEVCRDATFAKDDKVVLVDTYLKDATLNQIPVVRVDNLTYGTWYVRITAFYDAIFDHNYATKSGVLTEEKLRERYNIAGDIDFTFIPSESGYDHPTTRAISDAKKGQYNIYIDGIRVYNTLGTSLNAVSKYAYAQAGEDVANFLNVNDALVDATNANAWADTSLANETANGVLYVAAGATTSDQTSKTDGIVLGMEGALYTKQSGSKFYIYKDAALTTNVQYQGKNVYYRSTTVTSPYGRAYSGLNYFYDGGSASKPMNTWQIKEAFGSMPTYYNAKYSQYGPEKEVYLSSYNGVAFKVGKGATKVMVSLKSHNGKPTYVQFYDHSLKKFQTLTITTSRVEMYYDITKYVSSDGYVYIRNANPTVDGARVGGITSICNIKYFGSLTKGITIDAQLVSNAQEIFRNAELPLDESVEIMHSLDLASDISVNYVVPTAKLADYDYSFMEVSFNGATYLLEPEIRGNYGYFTVTGITAVDMTDKLTATLHMFLGEEEFISSTDRYSVADYAYAQLKKDSVSDELKAVCANLLRYGAQAQSFKGSDNTPADGAMTPEQKAYVTDLNTVPVATAAKALGDMDNGIAWAGKALVLDSKVAIKAVFNLKDFAGNKEDLNLRVSYRNTEGEEVNLVIHSMEVYNEDAEQYAFVIDNLLATEMRTRLTMALYEGETRVSETQIYSVESYCFGKTGALAELGKALLAYSDAAKAFFAK